MKKLCNLAFIFCTVSVFNVLGQSRIYKPFKVDLGITTVFAMEPGAGGGNGVYISPMFNLADRLCVGPRLESAFVKKDKVDLITGIFDEKIVDLTSYLFVMDCYLSKDRTRFFLGLGAGLFKQVEYITLLGFGSIDVHENSNFSFGVMPRFGFNVGHFKMAVNYTRTGDLMYDYLGITLGLDIGGGQR